MSGNDKILCDGVPGNCYDNKTADEVKISSFSTATTVANQTIIEDTTTTTPYTTKTTSSFFLEAPMKAPMKNPPKAPTKAYSTTTISPTDIDVLCGRGGRAIQHPGNRAFRAIVMSKKSLYHKLKKKEKRKISKSIVEMIRKKGGRFLQKRESSVAASYCSPGKTVWFEIGDDRAVSKTCQALREPNPVALPKKRGVSGRTTPRNKRCSDLLPLTSKQADRPNRSSQKQATDRCNPSFQKHAESEPPMGTDREPIAILNGQSYTSGSGGWEWKLFDFCDEEQTRRDDQLVPYQPPLSAHPALRYSPCSSSRQQAPPSTLEQRQYQPELDKMIASSKLYGRANSQPLAPPASMPEPNKVPVKGEY